MSWLVACSSRPVSDFGSRSDSDWWSCVSCVLIRDVAQPDLARPGPARSGPRAPGAPYTPHARAPPPGLFLSFDFSRAVTSLSLFHLSLSPRGALGFGDGDRRSLDPQGEFALPLPLPLSLSLPLPFFSPWPRALPSPARGACPGVPRPGCAPPPPPPPREPLPAACNTLILDV
jgi:hypothetical protein